jgi:3-oxoacyl-[acyl-carrier-protein] synthase II
MKPRAITGWGAATTLGMSREQMLFGLPTAQALTPPAKLQSFDTTGLGALSATEVPDFEPHRVLGDKGLRTLDRLTKLMLVASREALLHAGIKRDGQFLEGLPSSVGPASIGVCSSNAYGSLEAITELDRIAVLEDARYINPAKFPNTVSNSASGYVSIWEDLRALNVAVSDGNCGGLDAFACADMFLAGRRAEVMLVGGAEAMSEALYRAFEKLRAIGGNAILGEGSAFFVLEPEVHARARGANVLAEFVGYGTCFEPPPREGALLYGSENALRSACKQALDDAGIGEADVEAIVTSKSGIGYFDAIETRVFSTFPALQLQPKAALGETLGAGGSLAVATALAYLSGCVIGPALLASPATPNGAPAKKSGFVLVTALGYYGNASALVLRRALAS